MPLREYECSFCGHQKDRLVNSPDLADAPDDLGICPGCEGGVLELNEIAPTGRPRFTGEGFYETDHVNPKAPWRALGDEPPENVDRLQDLDAED